MTNPYENGRNGCDECTDFDAEEITAMAREAGIYFEPQQMLSGGVGTFTDGAVHIGRMQRFAALVATKKAEDLCLELNRQIEAVRYHCSDATKRDVAERALLDCTDTIRARSNPSHTTKEKS